MADASSSRCVSVMGRESATTSELVDPQDRGGSAAARRSRPGARAVHRSPHDRSDARQRVRHGGLSALGLGPRFLRVPRDSLPCGSRHRGAPDVAEHVGPPALVDEACARERVRANWRCRCGHRVGRIKLRYGSHTSELCGAAVHRCYYRGVDVSDPGRVRPEQMLRATAACSPASPPAMAELVAAARMRAVEAGSIVAGPRCPGPRGRAVPAGRSLRNPRLRSAPGDSQRRVRLLHCAPARGLTAARGRLRHTLCNPYVHTILTKT